VGEADGLEQRGARLGARRVGANAVEAEQGVLGRDVVGARGQRRVVDVRDQQLVTQALEVGEREDAVVGALGRDALVGQARGPEVERLVGGDAPLDGVDHAVAGLAPLRPGELEEGQDRARRAALVAEVEVIDVGLVEVDRLLDQAQAQDAGVEVDVAWGVGRDRGDVMQTLECHGFDSPPSVYGACETRDSRCVCNNTT
jgi:hypothetical protein